LCIHSNFLTKKGLNVDILQDHVPQSDIVIAACSLNPSTLVCIALFSLNAFSLGSCLLALARLTHKFCFETKRDFSAQSFAAALSTGLLWQVA
jgi:hypothetical protein